MAPADNGGSNYPDQDFTARTLASLLTARVQCSPVWSVGLQWGAESGDPAGGRRSDYNNYTSSDPANTQFPVLTNLNQIISCDRGHCRAKQIDSARRLIYFDNTIGLAENLGYNLIIAGACQRYQGTGAARRSTVTSGLD